MISGLDLAIYHALFQQKAITEKYIGQVEYEWLYSEVHYSAECTIGIPFDLFDKTITGILQVDDVLSIERIGEILGMNIIHNPDNQQYKDDAEHDILRMALDNLKNYGMIETGDIYYSACKLTDIGREYAQKGRKFKTESNKTFTLYYDHTTEEHADAKKVFQNLKGVKYKKKEAGVEDTSIENAPNLRGLKILGRVGLEDKNNLLEYFDFLDETLMKQIAEKQEAEIYNLERGNSFTNPRVVYRKSQTYQINLYAALLYDVKTKQFRLVAYEPNSKTINDHFSKWMNENFKDQILEKFKSQSQPEGHLVILSNEYIQALEAQQKEFKLLLNDNPEGSLRIAKDANSRLTYVDSLYFWNNLNDFISEGLKEFWFFLSEPNDKVLSLIEKFTNSSSEVFIFIITGNQNSDEKSAQRIAALIDQSKKLENNLFVINEGINTFDCFKFWLVNNEVTEFEEDAVSIPEEPHFYFAVHKSKEILSVSKHKEFKAFIAEKYLPLLKEQVEAFTNQEIDSSSLNKASILSFDNLDDKSRIFSDLRQNKDIMQQIEQIEDTKSSFIRKLKDLHKLRLLSGLIELTDAYEKQEFSSLEPLKDFSSKIENIEKELFDDYDELHKSVVELKNKTLEEEQRIRDEVLAKTFIIDTNVFIEEPDIISMIEKKHFVVLSQTVIQELDRLKQRMSLKDKASKALSILNIQLGKNKRLKTARANLNILSVDYRQNAPDNRILSVAYMYADKNPVLLTNDNGLQLKAKSLQIPTISLREFNGIDDTQLPVEAKGLLPKIDFKVIYEHTSGSNGKKRVDDFYKTIKRIQPGFDFKDSGYKDLKDFIQAIPDLEVYNHNFIRLKRK